MRQDETPHCIAHGVRRDETPRVVWCSVVWWCVVCGVVSHFFSVWLCDVVCCLVSWWCGVVSGLVSSHFIHGDVVGTQTRTSTTPPPPSSGDQRHGVVLHSYGCIHTHPRTDTHTRETKQNGITSPHRIAHDMRRHNTTAYNMRSDNTTHRQRTVIQSEMSSDECHALIQQRVKTTDKAHLTDSVPRCSLNTT